MIVTAAKLSGYTINPSALGKGTGRFADSARALRISGR